MSAGKGGNDHRGDHDAGQQWADDGGWHYWGCNDTSNWQGWGGHDQQWGEHGEAEQWEEWDDSAQGVEQHDGDSEYATDGYGEGAHESKGGGKGQPDSGWGTKHNKRKRASLHSQRSGPQRRGGWFNKCQRLALAVLNDDKDGMLDLAVEYWVSPDDPTWDESVYLDVPQPEQT
jgi:hypothetical protein